MQIVNAELDPQGHRHTQAQAGIEVGFVDVGRLRLRYAIRPGRGEPLLLCNGIGANFELALPLIHAIAARPVIIVDLPGTGGSDSAWFWPSLHRYARMLVRVVSQLGFSGRFAVAGVSWGGGLAQQIAKSCPDRVSHLVLMATSPGIFMLPGRPSALVKMLTPQRYVSREYMLRHAANLYGGEMRHHPERAALHAKHVKAPTLRAYLQQVLAMYQFSSLPWLHRLRCPALVLSGDDDPLIRLANAQILAALLPNARLHIMRGGGHLFMTLRAAETAALINDFLDGEST